MKTDYVKKRGYVKWTDSKGVKHKVRESEFTEDMLEDEGTGEDDVGGTYELTEVADDTPEGDGLV